MAIKVTEDLKHKEDKSQLGKNTTERGTFSSAQISKCSVCIPGLIGK